MSHAKVFELLTDIRNEFGEVVPASTAAEHQQTVATNAVAVPYGLAPTVQTVTSVTSASAEAQVRSNQPD